MNLNGLWDYGITHKSATNPLYQGQILVPFPIESCLSGVKKSLNEQQRLWYRRSILIPRNWNNQNVLLHFGAVDWQTDVYVNNNLIGSHKGGFDSFSFDITKYLKAGITQELSIAVWDPTDAGSQPRGKQVSDPRGIWYTSSSGIWQTVWLEPVPITSIEKVALIPSVDEGSVKVNITVRGTANNLRYVVVVQDGGRTIVSNRENHSGQFVIPIKNQKLWSPNSPFLYDIKVQIFDKNKLLDEVDSYFAMRKISINKDFSGGPRIYLNNSPFFLLGVLDQGFWPDGLYTAPSLEALKFDIQKIKEFGFNTSRKHVKVEPELWYYWCDRIGLLVWQDMPSGDKESKLGASDITKEKASSEQFDLELKRLLEGRSHHPSIVIWSLFNEGWGQHDTDRIVKYARSIDTNRLFVAASGWNDRNSGDVLSIHGYVAPKETKGDGNRAIVWGEFGGFGFEYPEKSWNSKKKWSYRNVNSQEQLFELFSSVTRTAITNAILKGLSGSVYTQWTDVENEVNGLLTYDRTTSKVSAQKVNLQNQALLQSFSNSVIR